MKFEEIRVGMRDEFTKTITERDIELFASISGDINPIHLDEEYAKTTIFKKRIAHGILVSGLISAVLANKLPGAGSIYLGQELKFLLPVYIGDEITAEVEVMELREDKRIIKLRTLCKNQDGAEVISGQATIKKQ